MSVFGFLAYNLLSLYWFCIFIYVLISMLISFEIINNNNSFVIMIMQSLYKIVEPALKIIRRFLPSFGSLDISPVILLIIISTLQYAIERYQI